MHAHGKANGYRVVVKSSSTPNDKKPGRTSKIWLRCDRGGQYRPRNGLTEENRKRRRTSRLTDCPFSLLAAGTPGFWTLSVTEPTHNHGPIIERPRPIPQKFKKGQIIAQPYDWPHDATFTPFTTALVIIDMQKDCAWALNYGLPEGYADSGLLVCAPGGYLEFQGYDISPTRAIVPKLQHLLQSFRTAGFPVYHTREGKLSKLFLILFHHLGH